MKALVTRRDVSKGIGAALLLGKALNYANAAQPLTANQVIERIQRAIEDEGVPWGNSGTDTFKCGNPDTPVTGIATTFQATLDVLQRAAAARKNLIITHERMFWDFQDEVGTLRADAAFAVAGSLEADPIAVAKRKFCEDNNLVVWRFHDHWHRGWVIGWPEGKSHRLDPIFSGLNARLGWDDYFIPMPHGFVRCGYQIPAMRLQDVARHIRDALNTRDVRVIGDPDSTVRRIGATAHLLKESLERLQDADVVLVSEAQEPDMFPYVRDAISLGMPRPRGLIVIAHEAFEEWGMKVLESWLRPITPEVTVEHIAAGAPYWMLPSART